MARAAISFRQLPLHTRSWRVSKRNWLIQFSLRNSAPPKLHQFTSRHSTRAWHLKATLLSSILPLHFDCMLMPLVSFLLAHNIRAKEKAKQRKVRELNVFVESHLRLFFQPNTGIARKAKKERKNEANRARELKERRKPSAKQFFLIFQPKKMNEKSHLRR